MRHRTFPIFFTAILLNFGSAGAGKAQDLLPLKLPVQVEVGGSDDAKRGDKQDGESRGRRERDRSEAADTPPAGKDAEEPQGNRRQSGERGNRAGNGGERPPEREAGPPPAAPGDGQRGAGRDEPQQPDTRRTRDEPAGSPPPRQAQPAPEPVVPPQDRKQTQTKAPPPQAQPPAQAPPPAAAQRDDDRNRDRGGRDRPERRQKTDRGPGEVIRPPTQQVQPAPQPGRPPEPAKQPVQALPPPIKSWGERRQAGPAPKSIDDIKRNRKQRVEAGGNRTVIEEQDRTIVQEKGGRPVIRHDETERMRRSARDVRNERRPDGGNVTIAVRPGGIEVYSEFDDGGRLMRRYRRDRNGREVDLIDNRRFRRDAPVRVDLGPLSLRIPRDRYILDYERASDDDLYDGLMDAPVERLPRRFSLDEVRYNSEVRDRMRRIDLDTVNFDFGSWRVPPDQYRRLERIARIIHRALDRRPDEVFLIEGHTDAVGNDIDNLTLSDRRAEEVAVILTDTFGIPFENLVTQGYGEEFLKVPTMAAERANRRVAVRRITPLLAGR